MRTMKELIARSGKFPSAPRNIDAGTPNTNQEWTEDIETELKRLQSKVEVLSNSQGDMMNEPLPDPFQAEMMKEPHNDPSLEMLSEREDQKASPSHSRTAFSGNADYIFHAQVYTLKESAWDTIVFLGISELGVMGSIWTGLALLANLSLQLLLCLVINESLTGSQIDSSTIEDLQYWRIYSGHAWEYVDKQSFRPLAQRVCDADGSIPMSSGVVNTLELIDNYMQTKSMYDEVELPLGRSLPFFFY
jgi:hypothetical protein